MTAAAEHAFQTVMALPADDRVEVLIALDEATEPTDAEVLANMHPAWKDELARRSAAIDAGLVKGIPWDEVQARMRKKVGLDG